MFGTTPSRLCSFAPLLQEQPFTDLESTHAPVPYCFVHVRIGNIADGPP